MSKRRRWMGVAVRVSLRAAIYLVYLLVLVELGLRMAGYFFTLKIQSGWQIESGNEYLIYCFGDSNVFGAGAPAGMGFPGQLEELLNRNSNGSAYVVQNFGRPGYNSSQTLEKMEWEVRRRKPHLAVVLCGANNFLNFYRSNLFQLIPPASFKERIFFNLRVIIGNFRVYKTIRYFFYQGKPFPFSELSNEALVQRFRSFSSQYQLLSYDFGKMRELAEKNGFRLLFLTYPQSEETLIKVLKERGFEHLDLQPIFSPFLSKSRELLLYYDGHPNVLGYRLMSLCILKYLVEKGLVKSADAYQKPLEILDEAISQASLTPLIQSLLAMKKSVEGIEELSSPQSKYQRIKMDDGKIKMEFYFRNGELIYIHFPGRLERFDPKAAMRHLDKKFIKFIYGIPQEIIDYKGEDFRLFNQRWSYTDGLNTIYLYFKDDILRYAHHKPTAYPYFRAYPTEIFNENLTVEEIKAIFGEPVEIRYEQSQIKLIYQFLAETMEITLHEKFGAFCFWKMDEERNSLIKELSSELMPGDELERLFAIVGKPDKTVHLNDNKFLSIYKNISLILVSRDNRILDLIVFKGEFDLQGLFEWKAGEEVDPAEFISWAKKGILWHLDQTVSLDSLFAELISARSQQK